MNVDFERCVAPLFVTPVINYGWDESETLNAGLLQYVLDLEQLSPTFGKSNVGGWHSALNFLEADSEVVRQLRHRLTEFMRRLLCEFSHPNPNSEPHSSTGPQFRLDGWANLLRHGQYNSVHSHPNAIWSGVYYVTGNDAVDDHPFSGKLELLDPRPGAALTYADSSNLYERILLNPQAGQMVVFPAWLPHQVHTYFGKGERLSIAFNAVL